MTEQHITVTKIEPDGHWWKLHFEGGEKSYSFTDHEVRAFGLTPPPPRINFDALPVGTVLADEQDDLMLLLPGGWTYNVPQSADDYYDPESHSSPYTVVHVPELSNKLDALHILGFDPDEINNWIPTNQPGPHFWRALNKLAEAARKATP